MIDSIQTIEVQDIPSAAGSVSQVRACTSRLQELAKTLNISVFITGHVTKSGDLAGPRTLEHIVDTVLYLEGDPITHTRILRSVKNRFGPSHEIGLFDMNEHGMVEVQLFFHLSHYNATKQSHFPRRRVFCWNDREWIESFAYRSTH